MAFSAWFRRFRCSWGLLAAVVSGPALAVDLGDASVMSMQGQRLKVAVPYGSAPGEKVPVMRFMVESVEASDGKSAPKAADFVISQPEFRNVVYLQSLEPVNASHVRLVLSVAEPSAHRVAYDLAIPPLAYATTPVFESAASKPRSGKRAKRAKRTNSAAATAPFAKSAKAAAALAPAKKACGC